MFNSTIRIVAMALCAMGAAQAAQKYSVVELPVESVDTVDNNALDAAGFDGLDRAYVNVQGYDNGVERRVVQRCTNAPKCRIVPPSEPKSSWQQIRGSVAGGWLVESDGSFTAARRRGTAPVERLVPNATAHGINRDGVAVGFTLDEPYQPFLYDQDVTLLPTLGAGHFARAYAINSQGVVVGEAEHPQRLNVCAVSWVNGELKVLSCPPAGRDATAVDVNIHGVAVGDSHLPQGGRHAVRYESGRVIDLGALGDPDVNGSWATAINDRGVVVGYGINLPTDGFPNAILFDPIEGALELASLVPEEDRRKYYFQDAQAISNAGHILVRGTRWSDLRQVMLRLEPLPQ
ncbi:MAG: hypothetical protein KAZ63_04740 [Vitreoscilla sp.]|nr:hypothetical protein [Vitreoscilla sp.]